MRCASRLHPRRSLGLFQAKWTFALALILLSARITNAASVVEGEFLVKHRAVAKSRLEATAETKSTGGAVLQRLGWQRIRLSAADADAAMKNLLRDPEVMTIEPNYLVPAFPELEGREAIAPARGTSPSSSDDPLRSIQWGLTNVAAPAAWQITTGSADTVVVVIDTGINYLHEDLVGNLWRNPGEVPGNFIDDDQNGYIDDVYGVDVADDAFGNDSDPFDAGAIGYFHGSMVAGIIGARARNGVGVIGLNHAVQLMAVRAIRTSNSISLADELEALAYVLAMKQSGVNIRVVNMSYGGMPFSSAERELIELLLQEGIVVCAAAGNRGGNNDNDPFYPASHSLDGLVSVAAVDKSAKLAKFPNHGSSNWGRTNVDLAAPGLGVASTFGPGVDDYDEEFFGTSAATPHVAGAAALLLAANPASSPAAVRQALIESADRLPALVGKVVSNGRLNIARALEHPLIAVGPPRFLEQPEAQSVVLSNRLELHAAAYGQHPRAAQWFHDDALIPGATNWSLVIDRVGMGAAGPYWLAVSNVHGIVTSEVATVTIEPLRIVSELASKSVKMGSATRFDAKVEGPKPIRYQWRFDGAPLPGATNAALKLKKLSLTNEEEYCFVASNAFGAVTSAPAFLTVLMKPVIVVPPLKQSVVAGGSLSLSVGFSGNPGPFSVQWMKGSVSYASNVVEGLEDYFTLPNVGPEHAGTWRVIVRNPASTSGTRRSFAIKVLADADLDGLPDKWELMFGYPTNVAQSASADRDGDGVSDRDEFAAGTDPTNALSRLAILSAVVSSNGTTLSFAASSNRTYTVERQSGTWDASWQVVADVPAHATNRTVAVTDRGDPSSTRSTFYRIVTPRRR
jgi:subtilisin family serine protease